jgi:hypothetical protein
MLRAPRPQGGRGLRARLRRRPDRHAVALVAALGVAGVLLVSPPGEAPPPATPVPAALAWPQARTGAVPTTLPDGSAYEPAAFLDAATSVGTAAGGGAAGGGDGVLRLVVRRADGSLRVLRSLPESQAPFFGDVAVQGDVLAWSEGTGGGALELWTANLRDGAPARRVTADAGDLLSRGSEHDLTIKDGRLHWAASDPRGADAVQLRSVALAGGPVATRTLAGTWQLSAWPWLVNGATTTLGATALRDSVTGREVRVARAQGLATTSCGPTWCEDVSQERDGGTRVELRRPDGSDRVRVPADAVTPAIGDVAPLDRFEVLSQAGPTTDVTGTGPLLVFELDTRRTVQLSADAGTVAYRHGVLWWLNGNGSTVWHSVDLRTV